ncbi:MAG: matrixin family metalloprotease [Isosphaeraceae bacterium]
MDTRSVRRVRGTPRRAIRPDLDALEGRRLLSYNLLGAQWAMPIRVTYSIMPDGTSLGGVSSNLQAAMNGNPNTASKWISAIQKAAAAWENFANVNLVMVGDSGAALGVPGKQQNDPRFGDIRIGGYVQPSGQLAFAFAPPPFNGGTDAGDILFNTNIGWNTNGTSNYDLYTVALHEFGHALGLGHDAEQTSSVMFPYYNAIKTTLSSDDQAGDLALYGPIPKDMFSSVASNGTPATASNITPYLNSTNQVALGGLTLTKSYEQHFFQITAPANTSGTMTVQIQATNLSSVIPTVKVLDASNKILATDVESAYSSTASVTIGGVSPGQVYRIQVGAGTSGPGSNGTYGLLVNLGTGAQGPIAPPDTTVPEQPDQNPITLAQIGGWVVGGRFVPYNGDFGWLGREGRNNRWQGIGRGRASDDDGLVAIHYGYGNVGYGDALTVSPDMQVRQNAGFAWSGGRAYAPVVAATPGDLFVLPSITIDVSPAQSPADSGNSTASVGASWLSWLDQILSLLG